MLSRTVAETCQRAPTIFRPVRILAHPTERHEPGGEAQHGDYGNTMQAGLRLSSRAPLNRYPKAYADAAGEAPEAGIRYG
jgi:hypothetical protein